MIKSKPEPVDVHVGSRVRLRRTLLGYSQDKLGKALKLTFQQIQKYERGANRIGSSRLYQLSQILDVPVSFFFDDMPTEITEKAAGMSESGGQSFEIGQLSRRETLELVRAYYKIQDPAVRKKVFEMVKVLGKSFSGK
ncbi:MAG: transcriptional regulator [Alphaproteobacteria bacterium]|nr:MAG: transcriptional regulator [Alphaproteobacteria bacterium]